MIVEEISTDKLIPYIRNPRNNKGAVAKVAASIKEFGFRQPIVVDPEMVVVAGHTRLAAAWQLGIGKVPVHIAMNLTEDQIRAYRIMDNRSHEDAEWDNELLAIEFGDLLESDFDMDLTGFTSDEIDQLLDDKSLIGELEGEDDAPETPVDPKTKLGDIYKLGEHRLMCGDSTSSDAVALLMDGQKADMVFTDPPYNINYGNIKHPKFKVRSIQNDDMGPDEFRAFCLAFASSIEKSCDGCIYVFGPPGPDGRIMFSALDSVFHCSTTVIWNKDQFTLGRGKYQNKYEPCWFGWNKDGSGFTDDRTLTNVWDHERPKASGLHPTMKPIGLIEIAISHASKGKDSVLDLFGGSGSTMIASEKLNRKCYMMELDPAYCDVIVERYEKLFDKKAEKIN